MAAMGKDDLKLKLFVSKALHASSPNNYYFKFIFKKFAIQFFYISAN